MFCRNAAAVRIDCASRPAVLAEPQSPRSASRLFPALLHLFLIHVLHDFPISRLLQGGNSRLNVNKISFPSTPRAAEPAAASLALVNLPRPERWEQGVKVQGWGRAAIECDVF